MYVVTCFSATVCLLNVAAGEPNGLKNIKPSHYELNVTIYADKEDGDKQWTFVGSVDISIDLSNHRSNLISLHAGEDLKITRLTFRLANQPEKELLEGDFKRNKDVLHVFSKVRNYDKEKYILHAEFQGVITNKQHGMFWTKPKGGTDDDTMIATQFEPQDARKVLPCFDEPDKKATFKLRITTRKGLTALSNGKILHKTLSSGNKGFETVEYDDIPYMSTYLLAIVVLRDNNKLCDADLNVDICVYYRKNLSSGNQKLYLAETIKYLREFTKLLEIPYGHKKLDSVILPNFKAMGMENWGLIIYYEGLTNNEIKQVVAHEVAHQWFGNLVTMDRWDNLWLNEGFATFFEMYIQLVNNQDQIMHKMARHAAEVKIRDTDLKLVVQSEIDTSKAENGDLASATYYHKAAAMVTQIFALLKNDAFTRAIQRYLNSRQFKNSDTRTMCDFFSKEAAKEGIGGWNKEPLDFYKYLHPWLTNKAYPVVHVSFDSGKLSLSQRSVINDTAIWPTPIFLSYEMNKKPIEEILWLTKKSEQYIIPSEAINLCVNKKLLGYYDVIYPEYKYRQVLERMRNNDPSSTEEEILHFVASAVAAGKGIQFEREIYKIKGSKGLKYARPLFYEEPMINPLLPYKHSATE